MRWQRFGLGVVLWSLWAGLALAGETAPSKPKEAPDPFDRFKTIDVGGIVFRFSAEERIRCERWNNEDLDDDKHDRDRRVYVRTRLRTDAIFDKNFRTVLELVDGREWDSERRPRAQNDDLDVHQAYVELGGKPVMVRLGRQELVLGSCRLVAAPPWSNILRTFDAARVSYTSEHLDVHAFCGSVVVGVDDEFNEHRHDERFCGIFTTLKPVKDHKIDLYVLRLHTWNPTYYVTSEDGMKGEHKRYTYGARVYGNFTPRWTYDVEAALQRGRYANDRIRAWAFHADTAYTFPLPWEPTLQPVLNLASGDRNPTDGVNGTFDPLYSATHNMYGGIMDLVTWSNIEVVGLRLRAKPVKKLTVGLEAHHYWLAEDKDAWYTIGKKARRRDNTGKSGDDIGCEVGCWARYTVSRHCEVEGGVAHFFPGDFAEKTGPSDGVHFCYLQTILRF